MRNRRMSPAGPQRLLPAPATLSAPASTQQASSTEHASHPLHDCNLLRAYSSPRLQPACPIPLCGTSRSGFALERNLVVHVAALATGTNRHRLTRLRTGGAEIAAGRLGAEVAAASGLVEHLEL